MPIHKVKGGYKWGEHGHVYPTREGAEKQAEAAYAHGYKGDAEHDPVSEKQRRAMWAAAEGESKLGIPEKVGKEFVEHASADESPLDELIIAKKIRNGELSSPQQYENIWLFDVRITGTGVSYRASLDEYVYRDPEEFLSDDFVERCNGLALIFEHPDKDILNTDEYRERAIGNVILPYVSGDEVRGIAKVFDGDAAELMQKSHISTSPAVVFRDAGSTETIEVDGKTVLIEGKPSLIDHLAICQTGVWDKGGDPDGVKNEGNTMADEMMEEDKVPAWADALMKRMDALESKGEVEKDSEESEEEMRQAAELEKIAAEEREEGEREEQEAMAEEEEAKADSESDKEREEGFEKAAEKEEKEMKADAAKKRDAEMQAKIDALQARLSELSRPVSNDDRDALSAAQARADSLAQMFGERITPPLHGESPISYRKRLADKFKKHSPDLKGIKLDSVDEVSFGIIEDKIYADAQSVAMNPETSNHGQLIPIVRHDAAGRAITTFTGDIDAWLQHFKAPGAVVKINRTQPRGE